MALVHAAFPACEWCGRDGIGFLRDEEGDAICVSCKHLPGPVVQPKPKRKHWRDRFRTVPPLPPPAR